MSSRPTVHDDGIKEVNFPLNFYELSRFGRTDLYRYIDHKFFFIFRINISFLFI